MLSSINEKYCQPAVFRNDIYRKFELQFNSCFLNNINIENDLYVEQPTDRYKKALDVFLSGHNSDIKFLIGYTGVGKTTFLKHYFRYRTLGFVQYQEDGIVIPISWDGKKVSDDGFEKEFDNQISNVLDNLVEYLYHNYETLLLTESETILDFINATRSDIITSLTIYETVQAQQSGVSIEQAKLQKSKDRYPVAFSSSLLKYVIQTHRNDIKRLIFIIDDLETLAQDKLRYLITAYLNIYDCLHNTISKPVVNLLISLRPHSFRFLKENIDHKYINGYGNFLENEANRIVKDQIPDVKEILILRFQDVFKKTENPGNKETWRIAKETFYEIISSLDENLIKTITELCHLNIRAVIDCLQMILSNRVWCQNYSGNYTEYPNVKATDYRFDIVNVIRTLACGENSVYTGRKDVQFNQSTVSNVLSRPRFDDSDVFIPNIFIDLQTRICDILPIVIMQYLEGYFSSQGATPPQTEFISKEMLCNNIKKIFGDYITIEKIKCTVEYLFNNRIIRKSIISKDSNETLNKLLDDDFVYLTLKGSRLLAMLESDSVLLEIYREDIKREYREPEVFYRSSFELISNNARPILFEDLINLTTEIYNVEDDYQINIVDTELLAFYELNFPISRRLIRGIEKSLLRSQNIDEILKSELLEKLSSLNRRIERRVKEMNNKFSRYSFST
ncbi:MAG: hypothetical protein E7589_03845 [Ruminococcaceae bacterium]|nr:hypothetical protein [Oscillospiraceae bacterium]